MKFDRRTFFGLAGAAAVSTSFVASTAGAKVIGGPAFGSRWRVCLPESVDTYLVQQEVIRIVNEIDAAVSPYRGDSEISMLNTWPAHSWVQISSVFATVFDESRQVAILTGGAFDPTVGPIVNRAGFGPITGPLEANFDSFEVEKFEMRKTSDEATLDFCGIAKGYALDLMASALVAIGVPSFLLEAGGELLAYGRHPDGRRWQVAIETKNTMSPQVVRLNSGKAIATSGTAHQGGNSSTVNFSHIVDPFDRAPIENPLYSVSVISDSAMRADALATALAVMGPDKGLEFAERNSLAALFQVPNRDLIKLRMTPEFASEVLE